MATRKPILKISNVGTKAKLDPIKRFEASIRSAETLKGYRKTFREFLEAVENFQGSYEEKARQFHDFAISKPDDAQNLIEDYVIHLKERTQKPRGSPEYLNPSVVPNKIKSIKKFCKMNRIQIVWEDIEAYYPEKNNVKQTRGFTTDEIKQILEMSNSVQTDFIITTMASSGIRIGAWNNIKWLHINPIYEENGRYSHNSKEFTDSKIVCASLVVYAGTSEEYHTLISIEAYEKLQTLKKQWIKIMKREPSPEDGVLVSKKGKPISSNGIRVRLGRLIQNTGILSRTENDRRHDVPFTHGFRKRYNKIMSDLQNKSDSHGNHIRKERLMGHKSALSQLEGSYYYSDILESVPQYLEGMPKLMISDVYRTKIELQAKQQEQTRLEREIQEKNLALDAIKELELKVDRIQRYQKKS
mgnify:CR=1 FL=1